STNTPSISFSKPVSTFTPTDSFRSWRHRYKDQEELLEKIKERWLDMCSNKKDVYFFVGNMWQYPGQFMVLGVFYPPTNS
ncbi:hypothetical protein ACFL3G_13390, partial [Planctomycetota bacterium]